MKDKCIILVAHISNATQVDTLEKCIASIRLHAPTYAVLLCATGEVHRIRNVTELVDHHILTSINTLNTIDSPLHVWYATPAWTLTYTIPSPRYYYGFAQLQKTALALQGAMALGYRNFLVMNYDTLIMENGFVDYMFSENDSVFFKFVGYSNRMSSDVFKLNMESAQMILSVVSNEAVYHDLAQKYDGYMLEDVLGELIQRYKIQPKYLTANSTTSFQLSPFKVLVNVSYNEGAMAVVIDNVVHVLVTNQGHPRHALDGNLEIGYDEQFTKFDVSVPVSILHPLMPYTGENVEFLVKTNLGEFPVVISKDVLNNTTIVFN